MARDTVQKFTIDIGAKINDFQSSLQKIQTLLSNLSMPQSLSDSFKNIFKNAEKEIVNFQNLTSNNQLKLIDEKTASKTITNLSRLWDSLVSKLESEKIDTAPLKANLKIVKDLEQAATFYEEALKKANATWKDDLKQKKEAVNLARQQETQAKNELATQKALHAANEKALKADKATADQNLKIEKDKLKVIQDQIRIQVDFRKQYAKEHDNNTKGWTAAFRSAGHTYDKDLSKKEADALKAVEDAQNRVTEAQNKYNAAVKQGTNPNTFSVYQQAIDNATIALNNAEQNLQNFSQTAATIDPKDLNDFVNLLVKAEQASGVDWKQKFQVDVTAIKNIDDLNNALKQITTVGGQEASKVLANINTELQKAGPNLNQANQGFQTTSASLKQMGATQTDIERLTRRLATFFSIDNAVRLFKRAIRSATESVKELDKVMTETAVVTDFTISDMWKQLPSYTKRANELGLAVKDVYEASTLYYQQGLSTNEVMQVTNATLRMARIAGLEAAEATDRMTNALRGFNMEINETNADNIADVYSKLAAISASNVDEISTAMTKVASLANSANMSFETTAAFLSQIIETTRESAETAGTALKTVVARFSEVKELFSKGELFGETEEGEEIDVNKVSKALRTADINLNEFLVGNKGLDEIFMELASKWDKLDIVQQRYIATMAAGSRQQSRFIALMSDYARTQQLVGAAQNAAGASMEQYQKTLDSVETKTNRLKNAWNEFLMGIANDQAIKFVLDFLNNLISSINKLTDNLSRGNGFLKSFFNILIGIFALKTGGGIVKKLFGDPVTQAKGWVTELALALKGESGQLASAGQQAGQSFVSGFSSAMQKNNVVNQVQTMGVITGKSFIKGFGSTISTGLFGSIKSAHKIGLGQQIKREFGASYVPKIINFKDIDFSKLSNDQGLKVVQSGIKNYFGSQEYQQLNNNQKTQLGNLIGELEQDKITVQDFQKELDNLNIKMTVSGDQARETGIKFKDTGNSLQQASQACSTLGSSLFILSTIIETATGKSTPLTKGIKAAGIAMLALGPILSLCGKQFWKFSGEATAAIGSIPIVGWVAIAISAIAGLITALVAISNHDEAAEAAERAKEAWENAKQTADEARQQVDSLSSSYKKLSDNAENIKNLKRGTEEWTEAVRQNNQSVLDLITKYKELQIVSRGGVLEITNYDEVFEQYQQRQINANISALGAQSAVLQNARTEAQTAYRNQISELTTNNTVTWTTQGGLDQKDVIDFMVHSLAEGKGLDEGGSAVESFAKYVSKSLSTDDWTFELETDELNQIWDVLNEASIVWNDTRVAIESNTAALLSQNLATAGLTEEEAEYTNAITHSYGWFESEKARLNEEYKEKGELAEAKRQSDFESWIRSIDPYYTVEDNKYKIGDVEYSMDDTGDWNSFIAWKAAQNAPVYQKQLASQLVNYENIGNEIEQQVIRAFKGAEGERITYDDLTKFGNDLVKFAQDRELAGELARYVGQGEYTQMQEALVASMDAEESQFVADELFDKLSVNELQNTSSFTYEFVKRLYEDLPAELQKELSVEDFGRQIISAYTIRQEDIDSIITNNPNTEELIQAMGGMSSKVMESFINQLDTYATGREGEVGEKILKGLKEIVPEDQLETVLGEFSKVSLNSVDDLEKFKNTLQTLGIDVTETEFTDFINIIQSDIIALTHLDLASFEEQIADLTKLLKEISDNKKINFTKKEKEVLESYGISEDEFTISPTGEYIYKGNSQNLLKAAQQGQMQQFQDEYERLRVKENDSRKLAESSYWDNFSRYTKRMQLELAQQEGNVDTWDITGFNKNTNIANLTDEEVDRFWNAVNIFQKSSDVFSDDVKEYQRYLSVVEAIQKGAHQIAEDLKTTTDEAQQQVGYDAMIGLVTTADIPQQLKDQYLAIFEDPSLQNDVKAAWAESAANIIDIYKKAKEEGLDLKSMEEYAKGLVEQQGKSLDAAAEMAYYSVKTNTGLKNILDNWEKIKILFDPEKSPLGKGLSVPIKFDDAESQGYYNDLKKNVSMILGLSHDLDDAFFQNEDNYRTLLQLFTGTEEERQAALNTLWDSTEVQTAIAVNNILNLFDLTETQYMALVNWFKDNPIKPEMEADEYKAMLEYLEQITGLTSDEIQGKLSFTQRTVEDYEHPVGYYYVPPNQQDFATNGTTQPIRVNIPGLKTIWTTDDSGGVFSLPSRPTIAPTISNSNLTKNAADKDKSTKDSASKEKLWKNPYDELYDLQEQVNDALREREKLEHHYQDMLKDHTKTAEDLTENTWAEVAALKQQLQLNKQLRAGRLGQIARVGNEMFEDSEGNRTTLAAAGATNYAYYDESTGVVQIDYDAIDKITDENLGNAVEQYVSRLEELRDQINDTEDTIEDINDQLFDIQDRGKEEYLGFEQKIYDAIVNQRQKEIETLEKINDSVTEAANKTINTIQDAISKERQARENDKAEQDILDKEMRLAYLQRDTSGANDLEIQKLQEEIANDQQTYQDKIIDQTIQEMQDEAERAAQQRQAQIDLLNYILEFDQQYGLIWENVEGLLQTGIDNQGVIKTNSELYKLLDGDNSPLSHFGENQWKEDLAKEIAVAMQGRTNYQLTEAKNQGTTQLANGTTLKYDKSNDKWLDNNGNEYTDLKWNLEKNGFEAIQHNKTQPKSNNVNNQKANIANKTTTGVNNGKIEQSKKEEETPGTVTYTVQKNDGPWQVAQAVYGSAAEANAQWQDVQSQLQAQGINELHPGQVVKIKRRYAQGGLADFTGPAWLDGTKSRPEMVLNAADTQNFITLKNILAQILNNTKNSSQPMSGGDNYFDIDIQAEIDSDYDVDRLADRIKQQIAEDASYRNVNMISQVR